MLRIKTMGILNDYEKKYGSCHKRKGFAAGGAVSDKDADDMKKSKEAAKDGDMMKKAAGGKVSKK